VHHRRNTTPTALPSRSCTCFSNAYPSVCDCPALPNRYNSTTWSHPSHSTPACVPAPQRLSLLSWSSPTQTAPQLFSAFSTCLASTTRCCYLGNWRRKLDSLRKLPAIPLRYISGSALLPSSRGCGLQHHRLQENLCKNLCVRGGA
jgi:hypothetical protein